MASSTLPQAPGAFDPNTDTLYGSDVNTNQLLTINTSTGAGAVVGSLGLGEVDVRGLAFDPNTNTLYGSENISDQLLTIETSTGAATVVGSLGLGNANVNGFAFDPQTAVPEPSSIALLITGGLCLFGYRRRRKHAA